MTIPAKVQTRGRRGGAVSGKWFWQSFCWWVWCWLHSPFWQSEPTANCHMIFGWIVCRQVTHWRCPCWHWGAWIFPGGSRWGGQSTPWLSFSKLTHEMRVCRIRLWKGINQKNQKSVNRCFCFVIFRGCVLRIAKSGNFKQIFLRFTDSDND